ncbi:PepSY-associated TM helix domain-containing protein [Porphyromonas macacae]|uniref:PepSY-associated TM helix domain-containing protein n=1 Tax=Porphyromonas macacae TaxID=28115 RepID=UPI000469BE13|nr:PepSY-associated TM helix domain-containing protein [Porphyromonas macacae]
MKFNKIGPSVRKFSRIIHRDLSFFFSGMVLIYAISGFVMNHRDSINPNYSITRKVYNHTETLPLKSEIKKEDVLRLLTPLKEEKNYTKHYFPQENTMKVFLKGGSSLSVNLTSREVVYEKLTRRPVIGRMTRLHYNPGRWWTTFADIFAISLIIITVTGLVMIKGKKGLWGRGGIYLLIGILFPLAFLLL